MIDFKEKLYRQILNDEAIFDNFKCNTGLDYDALIFGNKTKEEINKIKFKNASDLINKYMKLHIKKAALLVKIQFPEISVKINNQLEVIQID